MNAMVELLARVRPLAGMDSPRASLLLSFLQPPKPQANAVREWFLADPGRQRLRIIVDGQSQGFLDRTQVLGLAPTGARSPGLPPGASLPVGARLDLIALVCTQPDCDEHLWCTWYDPAQPPTCPAHPDAPCAPLP